jgi:hypothetical protein
MMAEIINILPMVSDMKPTSAKTYIPTNGSKINNVIFRTALHANSVTA